MYWYDIKKLSGFNLAIYVGVNGDVQNAVIDQQLRILFKMDLDKPAIIYRRLGFVERMFITLT